MRNNWLNQFPGSLTGPWSRYVHDADPRGIGTVRYPCLVAKDADCVTNPQGRTLTLRET